MSDDRSSVLARGEEFLLAVRRGTELTQELLAENERLRRRLVELEEVQQSAARSPEDWEKLRHELLGRIQGLEQEHDDLASLYVASCQLHSTLDVDEVVRILIEIAINLIGADAFAIYLLDEEPQELRAVAAEGLEPSSLPACRVGEGRLGEAVASGSTRIFETPPAGELRRADPESPLVCIPLRLGKEPIGAIAIFGLLPQKQGFSALDHALFDVLAGHAATAIFAARLHSQSERKLSTIQGFIDLLSR